MNVKIVKFHDDCSFTKIHPYRIYNTTVKGELPVQYSTGRAVIRFMLDIKIPEEHISYMLKFDSPH